MGSTLGGVVIRGNAAPLDVVNFGRDVLPILSENCFHCHGPDEKERKARLRLDTQEGLFGTGESGEWAVIPGKSAKSELILRVCSGDKDEVMPPPDANRKPTAAQIELLKRWVDQGAPWGKHWAYEVPQRPDVPRAGKSGNVRNPIDNFVLERLEREGLKPSPEADRRTLSRRLSFDLIGLPPDPKMVEAFVDDPRSDAYERLVESLLASPHFGERWGRYWLDLARYADSSGYLNDTVRPYAYLYRDWVIDAINRDLPFDQFTVEQLAGDLLPGATLEQKVATGFHRNSLKNDEAGADREEDRCKVAVDRVATTGAVWLGLTVGCAECHTHKFDQITQREFYQLYAFFNNTSDKDIPAPQPSELADYARKMKAWAAAQAALEAPLEAYLATAVDAKLPEWERSLKLPAVRWTVLAPEEVTLVTEEEEKPLAALPDQSIAPDAKDPARSRFIVKTSINLKGVTGFRVEALTDPGKAVGHGKSGDFALAEFSVMAQTRGAEQRRIELVSARADFASDKGAAAKAIDGDSNTGWSVGPQTDRSHVLVCEAKEAVDLPEGSKLFFELEHRNVGLMNRFRLSATTSAHPLEPSTMPDAILAMFDTPLEKRSAGEKKVLARYLAEHADDEGKDYFAALRAHEAKRPKLPGTTAATLTPHARETHIHIRGDFLRPGEEVQPGTLAVLHPFKPRGEVADRLDLARWLVDPANPLTPRVTVNQIWKNLFGRGLVATVDDFGAHGDKPSHPELLDYLATEFVRLGWSRKQMIRLIVNSATYRQSSAGRADLVDRDPLNMLLARQNRSRLEAEAVRDVFLTASGLLNPKIGGPSIYPPLPEFVTAVGRIKTWPASTGADQYRRGLYIHLRRNIPYPMLLTFDAPDTTVTCTRRERSNTPLQALTLLNDPVFVECSQALGLKIAAEAGDVDQRLSRAFQQCLTRPPTDAEMRTLRALYDDQLALTHGDAGVATAAAVRVIMNADEFITRE